MQNNLREPIRFDRNDQKLCDAEIKAGSKSFYAASLLLPKSTRVAARALYAFCRSSDDLVDEGNLDGTATTRLLARLDRIYQGTPDDTLCDRAFASVVTRYQLPRELPEALIEGFVWDETSRDYQTIDALLDYAARVASTVGVMMARIMGCTDRDALARAADLGLAMQLTNIARDVGEDARRNRIYLPADWLAEAGVDATALLTNPTHTPQLAIVVQRLLETADVFYRRALSGVSSLPLGCRPAIRSAALIYRDIGKEIRLNGYNSIDRRAHTSKFRKMELIALASATPFPLIPTSSAEPHPSVTFLVDAAALRLKPEIKSVDQMAGRMLELMAKAEHTRRSARQ